MTLFANQDSLDLTNPFGRHLGTEPISVQRKKIALVIKLVCILYCETVALVSQSKFEMYIHAYLTILYTQISSKLS